MNPYYLTEGLGYFGNGYSSGSGTSSPAGGLPIPGVGSGPNSAPHSGPGSVSNLPAGMGHGHGHGHGSHGAPGGGAATGPGTGGPSAAPSGNSSTANSVPPAGPSATSGPLVHPHQDLNEFLESFWTRQMDGVERETPDFKTYNLPLARIKKVMKSDEEVKMISAEAPIMFSKACEIFISELTCRAWLVAEGHKRRTLQKSDVAAAIAFSDVFDFLIDIVPRDGDEPASAPASVPPQTSNSNATSAAQNTAAPNHLNHTQHHPHAQHPHAPQHQHQQHHPHAQQATHGFEDDGHWQPADGGDYEKDVYDGYDEGRDSEALYSEYVQGEGEGFG